MKDRNASAPATDEFSTHAFPGKGSAGLAIAGLVSSAANTPTNAQIE
jgi:hypothetical protein